MSGGSGSGDSDLGLGSEEAHEEASTWFTLMTWFATTVLDLAKRCVFFGLCIGGFFAFTLYYRQDSMLFHPEIQGMGRRLDKGPPGYRSPQEHGMRFETLKIETQDGQVLHAWLLPQECGKETARAPTLVFFHGNAGNIGHRLPNAKNLYNALRANILMVDYRGYGDSTGTPSEEGLSLDGQAVMDALLKRKDIDTSQIFLFGRSLGGCVAIELAANKLFRPFIRGIIVENTFTSISDMVDKIFPLLSGLKHWVQKLQFPNVDRIGHVRCPVLFIAGDSDELIPTDHSRRLYNEAVNAKERKLYIVSGGGHNDCYVKGGSQYFNTIRSYINDTIEQTVDSETHAEATEEHSFAGARQRKNVSEAEEINSRLKSERM